MKVINTELTAAEICRNAITNITGQLIKLYATLENTGVIDDVILRTSPYNGGYRVEIESKINWETLKDSPNKDLLDELYKIERGCSRVFVQPCTFIESYLENGAANFEGQLPSTDNDYQGWRSTTFDNLSDGASQVDDFIANAKTRIGKAIAKVNTIKNKL